MTMKGDEGVDYFELIANRESCRNYADEPVEKEKLMKCIEAAHIAPSACNSQPWKFIAANDKKWANKIAACLQEGGMNGFADQVPAFIVVAEEKENIKASLGKAVKDQDFTSLDIGIAAAHICLAATAQGLSSCMLGWFNEKKLKAALGVSTGKRIRLVIAVGYAAEDKLRPKQRKDISRILTYLE